MKNILLAYMFLCVGICAARAQVPTPAQIQQIKVDDLTDEQIRQIVEEMKANKLSINQLDGFAVQKGIPSSGVLKLKARIRSLNLEKELQYDVPIPEYQETGRGINMENMTYESAGHIQPVTPTKKQIFGSELFSNKNLTFEPNLRIPTPSNYRLAAGDEILIDVYGYSEVQHKLQVSPEGNIRIPYLGPIYVNGLTMEEARIRITKQLSTIYGGIKSNNTFVQVSLGTIRSIKVLLIGEVVRPGTYTLPSLASVANALYVSGGPDDNGSFRDIEVVRGGSVVARFDLYDFLTRGDLSNNIILQDQDIVKVNPYKTRVTLEGQVKRPAIFEAKEGETLQTILDFAGGFTDLAFRDIIRASRINSKQREIITVEKSQTSQFPLHSGDRFFVDAILDRFTNRVTISGAVFHPGDYALEKNMTVSDLIKKADGVMEIASLSRGIIRRMKEDYTPSILNFNVLDVLSGKQLVELRREDSVVIYSKLDLQEPYKVKISGMVNNAGYFEFADSMRLEDLILMAGGFKDAASMKRIEISRRIRGKSYSAQDTLLSIVEQFDVQNDLRSIPNAADYFLQPFDEIVIRKSPTYIEQVNVTIDGEVVYPGNYTINTTKERISDLLRRAGGFKAEAYPQGAVMLRKTYVNASDSALLTYKLDVFTSKQKDSLNPLKLESDMLRNTQIVNIDLNEIIKNPRSKYDLILEEGDIVKIPKKLETVQLFGEVYFPKKIRHESKMNFRDYIRQAGGFTSDARRRRSYIVYANGDVKSTRKTLFFNSYPKVKPGAEIYIPSIGERKGLNTQEVLGLTTGMASLALIVVTILNLNK